MPKKEKPLTKKERDEKRKKHKEKQSKTQKSWAPIKNFAKLFFSFNHALASSLKWKKVASFQILFDFLDNAKETCFSLDAHR